jgi:hypothetical protein
MTKVIKVKSRTVYESQCGCGHKIRYRTYKRHLKGFIGYNGYGTLNGVSPDAYYYKASRFGTWRLDNHYYKCEEAQNES